MDVKKSSTVTSDFKLSLKNVNDSSFDQLEFRSLESNTFSLNTKANKTIKNCSYSEVVKAFIHKLNERNKKEEDTVNIKNTQIASSTPFKKSEIKSNNFDISGIALLDFKKRIEETLNDSDFESMDQDQYEDEDVDDAKENIYFNEKSNVSDVINCIQIVESRKKKSSITPTNKFKRNFSPYKRKCSVEKIKLSMIDQSSLINNELTSNDKSDLANFTILHPNKTQSFEASIKNISKLSVSI
jgi:hypothetical protein